MRDIKFRVWDNLEKAYLNEEDVAIDNRGNVFIFEIYDKNDSDVGECAGVAEPLFELTNLEVIGNIHEDSELVEEK